MVRLLMGGAVTIVVTVSIATTISVYSAALPNTAKVTLVIAACIAVCAGTFLGIYQELRNAPREDKDR